LSEGGGEREVWRREAHLEKKGASFKEGGALVHERFALRSSYIYISPNWFSPWGFFQGHVDQKLMCSFVMYA
jgi:hypothetical protein